MALKPENPVVGGTVLRRAAIQSPNYAPGVSGWTVKQDGSAEFNNLTIRGTFMGTTFLINSSGAFFYSPSEGAGNLVASITPAAGTDPFGNSYQAGLVAYSGSAFAQLISGVLNFMASSGQNAPGLVGTFNVAGQCGISSGKATTGDSPTNVIAESQVASGVAGGQISLQAGNVVVTGTMSVNGSTSVGFPNPNATSTNGIANGQIAGTSGGASAGTAHTHGAGSYAVTSGQHSHDLQNHGHPL